MKAKYRSREEINHDLLVVIRDSGTTNSHTLSRRGNLGHYVLVGKLKNLKQSNLITPISQYDNYNYNITDKGRKYIELYEQLVSMENELDV